MVAIFMEGLEEPLKGFVKAFNHFTLKDTFKSVLALESLAMSSRDNSKEIYQPSHKRKSTTNQEGQSTTKASSCKGNIEPRKRKLHIDHKECWTSKLKGQKGQNLVPMKKECHSFATHNVAQESVANSTQDLGPNSETLTTMNGTNKHFTIKGEQLITKISHEKNIPSHKVCLNSQNDSFGVHTIEDDLVHKLCMEIMTSKEEVVLPKEESF